MKRNIIGVILILSAIFCASGQNSNPVDLIVLLDTSSSMSSSYREVNDYITGPFLKEFLRIGDTFHLIAFSDKPEIDIARRIQGRGDVEIIIGRMLLQYPLGSWSDIPAALSYAESYASSLPPRPKKIILISDGDVSPVPGASSRVWDATGLQNLIDETKARLDSRGIGFDFVKVPIVRAPESGRTPPARQEPAAPAAAQSPPAQASRPAQSAPVPPPDQARPPSQGAAQAAPPPPATAAPAQSPAPRPPAAPERRFEGWEPPLPLLIGLAILGLLVLFLIIFLVVRQLQGSPKRALARAALPRQQIEEEEEPAPPPFEDHSKDLASFAASQKPRTSPYVNRYKSQPVEYGGPLLLNLFVEDQNTFIGKRNIHSVKPGYAFTVGGRKSDFLIFLVPLPPHIGEVRCDDNRCTFIPRKPQYFPDLGSQQVPDCIGKMIRIVSDKGYELRFRMERYE
ncbi:MAG: VWA domain-containing protein, partial [Treponema sp.]|nr:VWA domain-containing protein [Treponema sp.]